MTNEEVVDLAYEIAVGRQTENKKGNKQNADAYNHNRNLPLDDFQSQWFAAVVEIRVALLLGVDPYTIKWVIPHDKYEEESLSKNADVPVTSSDGTLWKVEARNATSAWSPLPLKWKDDQANLVVVQGQALADQMKVDGTPVKGEAKPTGEVVWMGWRYGSEYSYAKADADGTHNTRVRYDMADLLEVVS